MPIPSGDRTKQTAEAEHIGPDYTGDNISAKKTAGYAYDVASGEWRRVNTKVLGTQLETTDSGLVTNTIIHGKTTAGGGSYVDVKVTPSGALTVETTTTSVTERYDTSNSPILYVGYANVGTSDSSTGWTITKYDVTTSSAMSGKIATDVSWDNRASGTYN